MGTWHRVCARILVAPIFAALVGCGSSTTDPASAPDGSLDAPVESAVDSFAPIDSSDTDTGAETESPDTIPIDSTLDSSVVDSAVFDDGATEVAVVDAPDAADSADTADAADTAPPTCSPPTDSYCPGAPSGPCVNTMTDRDNCGGCGMSCPPTQSCIAGSCDCASGLALCGGVCVDTSSDPLHCGGCGKTCSVCIAGECSSVTSLALGYDHSCAVMGGGSVRCWGINWSGVLGYTTTETCKVSSPCSTRPKAVPGLSGVASMALGYMHSCALGTDGTVRCWGDNAYGQLGDGTTTNRTSPTSITGLADVTQLVAGDFHTCARLKDGTVRCWGRNHAGQVGSATSDSCSGSAGASSCAKSPTAVPGAASVVEIATGNAHTCARTSGGATLCWGSNAFSQLGYTSSTTCPVPGLTFDCSDTATAVPTLTKVAQLALGGQGSTEGHTCTRHDDGTVECWGSNMRAQLGAKTTTTCAISGTTLACSKTPISVSGLTGVTQISASGSFTCARRTDGSVDCWGADGEQQLGRTYTELCTIPSDYEPCSYVPGPVEGVTGAVEVVAGGQHACARLSDGGVWCWGLGLFGELGTVPASKPGLVQW
ncbi:MAG: hypothetical protein ACXVEF_40555 [Polyangiales bacterium]